MGRSNRNDHENTYPNPPWKADQEEDLKNSDKGTRIYSHKWTEHLAFSLSFSPATISRKDSTSQHIYFICLSGIYFELTRLSSACHQHFELLSLIRPNVSILVISSAKSTMNNIFFLLKRRKRATIDHCPQITAISAGNFSDSSRDSSICW